ncbi:DUF6153 family protein [Nocardia sp. NPDC052254]|uniref:DUF6153 family protein n=1 Tax=Nocardia sp. NPDC052254 TaxID=3155681 RepID=UPI0034468D6C
MPAPNRFPMVPGYVRALGVLTLMLGIALMHTLVFATGHAMAAPAPSAVHDSPAAHVALGGHTHHTGVPAADPTPSPQATTDSGCDGCMPHGGMHACVFVLVALALALGLAVIAWVGADGRPGSGRRTGSDVRRARPPPWTVLSLAELAILRI